jgi:hypothetical protein
VWIAGGRAKAAFPARMQSGGSQRSVWQRQMNGSTCVSFDLITAILVGNSSRKIELGADRGSSPCRTLPPSDFARVDPNWPGPAPIADSWKELADLPHWSQNKDSRSLSGSIGKQRQDAAVPRPWLIFDTCYRSIISCRHQQAEASVMASLPPDCQRQTSPTAYWKELAEPPPRRSYSAMQETYVLRPPVSRCSGGA